MRNSPIWLAFVHRATMPSRSSTSLRSHTSLPSDRGVAHPSPLTLFLFPFEFPTPCLFRLGGHVEADDEVPCPIFKLRPLGILSPAGQPKPWVGPNRASKCGRASTRYSEGRIVSSRSASIGFPVPARVMGHRMAQAVSASDSELEGYPKTHRHVAVIMSPNQVRSLLQAERLAQRPDDGLNNWRRF